VVAEKVSEFRMTYFRDFELFENYYYLNVGNFQALLDQYQSPDRIPGYAGKKSIVIDAASDPWDLGCIKSLAERCKSSGVISAILVNDKKFAEQNQDLNFRFFPVWAYRYAEKAQEYSAYNFFSQARTTRVSCLNRNPHLHRVYIYYLLQQLPWHNDIFLSFYGLKTSAVITRNFSEISLQHIKDNLGPTVADFFSNEIKKFPITSQSGYAWDNCHRSDSPAYTDCYSNLCTESSVNRFCPTEKTFKCITAGTLIFPISSCGFVASLKNIGLDIDYTGLNLSAIDSIPNWKLRTEATISLLDQLYDNIADIWHNNLEQLQFNQQVLQSKQLDNILLKNVQDHL
jgi:hypothetical protein